MKLSVVSTLYQSATYIEEFYHRVTKVASELAADSYEIVLVNDGSPDRSLDLAVRLTRADPHVIVVDLSKNFGHHKAMMTGLAHSNGEYIFLIDSDLEECPEWLLGFYEQMLREGCDVVYGVQDKRKGSLFERWSGRLFYSLFRILTGVALPRNIVVARLMSRRYVNALLQHGESEIFMAGLWTITGFAQSPKTISKENSSITTYTLGRKLSQFVSAITSFSSLPLVSIFVFGLFVSLVSIAHIVILLMKWFFFEQPPDGWTSVVASVWLFGGLITLFIGIIGIYLSKIYLETKQRPITIVRQIYGKANERVNG